MPKGIYIHKHTPWNKGLKVRLNPGGEFKKGAIPWNKGKKHSEETKKKISETKKAQKRKMSLEERYNLSKHNKIIGKRPPIKRGKENYFWNGGKSFEKYPQDWNKTLKRSIRERDMYVCQLCSEQQGEESLSIHHIDYDKFNCNPDNLISLCRKCHGMTTHNRNKWTLYFKERICIKKLLQPRK